MRMRRKGGVRSFLGEKASAELGWEICEPATHLIPPFLSYSISRIAWCHFSASGLCSSATLGVTLSIH